MSLAGVEALQELTLHLVATGQQPESHGCWPILTGHNRWCSHALQVKWLRVVLDEGHCIKNAAANQAKAARKLEAWSRWSVTGTPIQNS